MFAMTGFLEALRTELLDAQVNVMWVSPGFTASNIRNVALDKDARPQLENPLNLLSTITLISYTRGMRLSLKDYFTNLPFLK